MNKRRSIRNSVAEISTQKQFRVTDDPIDREGKACDLNLTACTDQIGRE